MRCAARRCETTAAVAIDRGVLVQVACDRHAVVVELFDPSARVRVLRRRRSPDVTIRPRGA